MEWVYSSLAPSRPSKEEPSLYYVTVLTGK
jgi:hypothetical protein